MPGTTSLLSRLFAATLLIAVPAARSPGDEIKQLFPTARGGREWSARWGEPRTIERFKTDPLDPVFRNSDGTLTIAGGIASAPPVRMRMFVNTPRSREGTYELPPWKNVEMTVYFRCGEPTQEVDGQAVTLSARSGERHNSDFPCEGTSYHASLRFDGRIGFKKEIWHNGGYTELRPRPAPRPWDTVPRNQWIGLKFVCRNCHGDQHVHLQLYMDAGAANDWKLVAELTDGGDWASREDGCERPRNFILNDAYPSVYFRTDFVPIEARDFSIREIDPLP